MGENREGMPVCGSCIHNRYSFQDGDFFCTCEASDCYGWCVDFMHYCDEYSKKKIGG